MLTTAQVTTLSGMLAACRSDWDKAGVHVFATKLATDPRPWPVLIRQAVSQAADARNLTPKCILTPLPVGETVGREAPRNDPLAGVGAVWCGIHLCNTTLRDDDEKVCCWQDRVLDSPARKVSPVKPYRSATPPPADFRARVERARQG